MTDLTITEAVAVLNLQHDEMVGALLGGVDANGRMSMSQLLGCRIINELRMIPGSEAEGIALSVFMDADATKSRCIAVGWRADGTRLTAWVDQINPELLRPLNKAMLILPVDKWLAELTEAVAELRAMTARPN